MGSWWEPGSSETFVCVSTLSKMKRKAVVRIVYISIDRVIRGQWAGY